MIKTLPVYFTFKVTKIAKNKVRLTEMNSGFYIDDINETLALRKFRDNIVKLFLSNEKLAEQIREPV